MKNVQVIDGALNCEYAIFAFTDEQFKMVFPAPGQNIEFNQDLFSRINEAEAGKVFYGVWKRKIEKKPVCGIHGTLFYELEYKRKYYPTKRDDEMWDTYSVRSPEVSQRDYKAR